MVRIGHLLDKMPAQCSGGESQRVALARTLVTNPSTFLLDEPLSSLDAKLRRELRAECDRLHQTLKRTFIFVTHDQEEAMTLADRIVGDAQRRDRAAGSPMAIYSDPVSLFRRRSLRLPVDEPRRRRDRSGRWRTAVPLSALRYPVAAAAQFRKAGRATLGIRPEHVGVRLGEDGGRRASPCAWSSRSARTRSSISTTAPRAPSSR